MFQITTATTKHTGNAKEQNKTKNKTKKEEILTNLQSSFGPAKSRVDGAILQQHGAEFLVQAAFKEQPLPKGHHLDLIGHLGC